MTIPLTVAVAMTRAEQLAPGCSVDAQLWGEEIMWHITVRGVRPEYAPALIAAGFAPLYSHARNGLLTLDRSLAAHYAGAAAWGLRLPR